MPITVNCPCGRAFVVAENRAGKWANCPTCDRRTFVPGPSVFEPNTLEGSSASRPRKVMVVVGLAVVFGLTTGGWLGVRWYLDNTTETVQERLSTADATKAHNAAMVILNEADRMKNRGERDAAITGYRSFLDHPGSTAFSRLADDHRKANREIPTWLVGKEQEEHETEAIVAGKRDTEFEGVKKLLLSFADETDPFSVEVFSENFRARCRIIGINPEDGTLPTVEAFRLIRALMLQRNSVELARISGRQRAAVVSPQEPSQPRPVPDMAAFVAQRKADQARKEAKAQADWEDIREARRHKLGNANMRPESPQRQSADGKPRFSLAAEKLMSQGKVMEKSRKMVTAISIYRHVIRDWPGTEQAVAAAARIEFLDKSGASSQ